MRETKRVYIDRDALEDFAMDQVGAVVNMEQIHNFPAADVEEWKPIMNVENLSFMMKLQDEKLRELMGPEEHMKLSMEIAKKAFRKEVEEMEDSKFKTYVLENFDMITA